MVVLVLVLVFAVVIVVVIYVSWRYYGSLMLDNSFTYLHGVRGMTIANGREEKREKINISFELFAISGRFICYY